MKAKINEYTLDGKYLNRVSKDYTTFYVPKGERDRDLIEMASRGIVGSMSSYCEEWCLTVETNKIKWED